MAPAAEQVERAEFRNTTNGWIGAIKLTSRGEVQPVAVAPGDTVWLSEEEQELTANAPRKPQDSPFEQQPYTVHDRNTGEVVEEGTRAQLEMVDEARRIPGRSGNRSVPGTKKRNEGDGQEKGDGVDVPADGEERTVEVGAATPPAGDPPTGEYASGEEVGTPVEE